ncbi:hypothetical protein [Methanoregula sp.]|uniref:hypothetical protein n=1 Tax=Methanoregula sp. TaxID=2052170 RepID=UPI0025E70FB2|nr:hypothetical protein [Methanoregula sp.]
MIAALFLFTIAIALPVSAVSISESPDAISRGGVITITMNGLNDGSQFSLLLDGQFAVTPGSRFSFETNNFNMPISLENGQIAVTTQGTKMTSFSVEKHDGATVNVGNRADANGFFSLSQAYSMGNGLYDYIQLGGQAGTSSSMITTSMNLLGTKKGPANSQITFTVDGIDNGLIRVTAMVDNQMVLPTKTITVGKGLATTTTIPVTTITQTTTTTAQPTGTTTQVGITQTTTTVQPTDTTTQVGVSQTTTAQPSGTTTETGTPTPNPSGTTTYYPVVSSTTQVTPVVTPQTFTSADQKVSLTATGVDYAGLLMVTATGVPDTWLSVYDPYTIAPDTLTFSPPATISFAIPAPASPGTSYAYFIGEYNNGQWTAVPSTPGYGSIDAEIDQAGTYGLMAFKPESTIQPAATGTGQQATPTPLVQVTSTPRIASIAQVASPSAAPTKAPLDSMVVTGALAIGVVLFARMKR